MPPLTQSLLLAFAAAFGLIFSLTPRLPIVLFVLGALVPIWSIGALPPVLFDCARYGLAALLAVRLWTSNRPSARGLGSWVIPIMVTGLLVAIFGWLRGDAPTEGFIMAVAAFLAWAVISKVDSPWPLFIGFASSVTVSAAVILTSAAGVAATAALAPNQNAGVARFTGLGSSAVRVSIELAVAIMIFIVAYKFRQGYRLVFLAGICLCAVALLVCGGRTGLFGLCLALFVGFFRRWIGPLPAVLLASGASIAIYQATQDAGSGTFNTLDRIVGPIDERYGGFTSGRSDLLAQEWSAFLESPLIGSGGGDAHFAPLYFAAKGGFLAGGIIVWLTGRLFLVLLRPAASLANRPETAAAVLASAVFLAAALVEPYGPFFGLEFLLLLFGGVGALAGPSADLSARDSKRSVVLSGIASGQSQVRHVRSHS